MSFLSNTATTEGDDRVLRTRHLALSLLEARRIIEEIIPAQRTYTRRWRHKRTREIRDNDAQPKGYEVVIEIPVVIFTDDLVVTVRSDKTNENVTVDARSASRTGHYDFGENRRHIKRFLRALDERSKVGSRKAEGGI